MKKENLNKLYIRFFLKKDRRIKISGVEKTLLCRITFNGVRSPYDFATDIKVNPLEWCAKSQFVKGAKNKILNDRLGFIKSQIQIIYSQLLHLGEVFTTKDIMNEYLGKNEKKITLLDMYERYIVKNRDENKKAKSTVLIYCYQKKKLEKYLKETKALNMLVGDVTPDFCKKLIIFIEKNASNYHAVRNIDTLKRVVLMALEEKYIKFNPLQHYKEPRKRVTKIPAYLNEQEIWIIENTVYASEVLQIASDLFVFQCYTGFSYADLVDFDLEKHTLKEKNNEIWISKLRVKLEGREHCELAELPLFPEAQKILDKYNGKLPYLRNDHYNNYLKQIAEICNIKKRLHTHLARKTAGDRWLNKGISLEVVAKMLGHQSPVTTSKHYAKVRRERVSKETKQVLTLRA